MDPIAVDLPGGPKPAAPKPAAKPDAPAPAAAEPFGLLGWFASVSRKQAIGAAVAALSLGAGVAVVKYGTPAVGEKLNEKLTTPEKETAKAPPPKTDPPPVPHGPPGSTQLTALPQNPAQYHAVPPGPPTAMPLPATLPQYPAQPQYPATPLVPAVGPEPVAALPPYPAPRVVPDVPAVAPPLPTAPLVTPAEFSAPGARTAPLVVPAVPPATLPLLPPAVVPIGGIEGKNGPVAPAPTAPQLPATPPLLPALPAAPGKVDLPALPSVVPSAPAAPPPLPAAPSVAPTAPPLVPTPPAVAPVPPSAVFGAPITPGLPTVVPDPPALPTPPGFGPTPPAVVPYPPSLVPNPAPAALPPTVTPAAGVRPSAGPDRAPQTTFDVDMHEPKAGDTYESISKAFYNDARYAGALAAYNRNKSLTGGGVVDVPPVHVLRQRHGQLVGTTGGWNPPSATDPSPAFRAAGAKRFVVPAGGLSLDVVAQQTLGSRTRWREIYDLNPGVTPELVRAGTDLRLPPDATVP